MQQYQDAVAESAEAQRDIQELLKEPEAYALKRERLLAELKEKEKEAKLQVEQLEKKLEELTKLLEYWQNELEEAALDYEKQEAELQKLQEELEKYTKQLEELKVELEKATNEVQEWEEKCNLCKIDIKKTEDTIEMTNATIKQAENFLAEINNALNKVNMCLQVCTSDLANAEAELKKAIQNKKQALVDEQAAQQAENKLAQEVEEATAEEREAKEEAKKAEDELRMAIDAQAKTNAEFAAAEATLQAEANAQKQAQEEKNNLLREIGNAEKRLQRAQEELTNIGYGEAAGKAIGAGLGATTEKIPGLGIATTFVSDILATKKKAVEEEIARAKESLDKLQQKESAVSQSLVEAQKSYGIANANFQQKKTEKESAGKRVDTTKEDLARANSKLSSVRGTLSTKKSHLQSAKDRHNQCVNARQAAELAESEKQKNAAIFKEQKEQLLAAKVQKTKEREDAQGKLQALTQLREQKILELQKFEKNLHIAMQKQHVAQANLEGTKKMHKLTSEAINTHELLVREAANRVSEAKRKVEVISKQQQSVRQDLGSAQNELKRHSENLKRASRTPQERFKEAEDKKRVFHEMHKNSVNNKIPN